MAASSFGSVPEALFTVAEHTLKSQPVFLGLTGAQLSRIAREVYVQLKKSGNEGLAAQAEVLTDQNVLTKALQAAGQLLPFGSSAPSKSAHGLCPCCAHRNACAYYSGHQMGAPQPQIVPIIVQQQPPKEPMQHLPVQQQLLLPQQQQLLPQQYILSCQQPEHRQCVPGSACPMQLCNDSQLQQGQQQQQQQPGVFAVSHEDATPAPKTSRKACVARLLFAIVAAKIARDRLRQLQIGSRSGQGKTLSSSSPTGMGAVSVDSLAADAQAVTASLLPRKGLFAELQQELLQTLQSVVSAAIDGANAAAAAVGYGPRPSPARDVKAVEELPPLYLSPGIQGRTTLTPHEKQSQELMQNLLNMDGQRSLASLRLDTPNDARKGTSRVQIVANQGYQQPNTTCAATTGTGSTTPQGASVEKTVEESLDEEFKTFLRRAEQYKGPSSLSIEEQLRFYGLFKRATAGKCTEKQPSRFNLRQFKKWEAWKACDGMTAMEAKREYVKRARELAKMQDGGSRL